MKISLILLTFITGLIDAFSYLTLGHVFVANMTGNVVFLALAFMGAPGFSLFASLLALGAFLTGAFIGGTLGSHLQQPISLLSFTAALQSLLVGGSALFIVLIGAPLSGEYTTSLIIILGIAMGMQNAVARKLAFPDLTTTVLTLTLTGISADSRLAGGSGSKIGRRMLAVGAMFLGAGTGGLLIIRVSILSTLITVLTLLSFISGIAQIEQRVGKQTTRQESDNFPITQELTEATKNKSILMDTFN